MCSIKNMCLTANVRLIEKTCMDIEDGTIYISQTFKCVKIE